MPELIGYLKHEKVVIPVRKSVCWSPHHTFWTLYSIWSKTGKFCLILLPMPSYPDSLAPQA